MSNVRYNLLLAKIKKNLQESSNYPAGAINDPSAPWNISDRLVHQGKSITTNLKLIDGDKDTEVLVSNGKDFYIINIENLEFNHELKQELIHDYGETPYDIEGRDEDGDLQYNYDDKEAMLSFEDLLSAAQDVINKNEVSTAEEYSTGNGFVYKLDAELAQELDNHHRDLANNSIVRKIANNQ